MIYQLLVVAIFAVIVIEGNVSEVEGEVLETVQQRSPNPGGAEILFRHDEKSGDCLKEGAVCSAWTYHPPCCGWKFRCVVLDHKEASYPGGPEVWVSNCRQWA